MSETPLTYPTPLPELWGLWCPLKGDYLFVSGPLFQNSLVAFNTAGKAQVAASKWNSQSEDHVHPARIKAPPGEQQP